MFPARYPPALPCKSRAIALPARESFAFVAATMIESFSAAAMDVLQDRILPLILARVGQAVVDPDSWGVMELVVVGLFTQIGLEVYKHGVPEVFSRWKHLPARGKPLEVLESRDRQYIAFSQIAIVVMTFHYLQASSP